MQAQTIKDVQFIRQVNRSTVLELLRRDGPMPRLAIARATKLTPPTSFAIVEQLVAADLVRCVATSRSSSGRPRAIFQFNPSAAFSLGVDLSGASMVGVLIDLSGNVLEERRARRPDPPEVECIIPWVSSLLEDLRTSSQVDFSKLSGVGVAVPGLLDAGSGHVVRSTNLNWHEVPFAEMLSSVVGTEVCLENTARSIALCERWFGAGSGVDHLACVNIGMGIGMGLIIDGNLYSGVNYQSGELGHTIVVPNGPLCRCGRRGCLEAVASGRAILRDVTEALLDGRPSSVLAMAGGDPHLITLDMVSMAAEEGDVLAEETMRRAALQIGLAVSNAVTLLNPRMVVLSGSLVHSSNLMFQIIADTVRSQTFVSPNALEAASVVRASLGPLAGAVGAAGVVHHRRMGLYDGVQVLAS